MSRIRFTFVWIVLFLLLLLLNACGGGRQPMESYDKDGVLGTTNVNPNLRTSPSNTYTNDQELVKKTLAKFEDVQRPVVLFNGATIVVYYDVPDRYTAEQARGLENGLRQELQEMLPRYKFDLRRAAQ